jgi:ribose-phosphate pyrophosphokinase
VGAVHITLAARRKVQNLSPFEEVRGIRLFALGATRPLGEAVGRLLGVGLARHEERDFEDGEHKSRTLEGVSGADVYVLHSLHGDDEESGNDKLCRLLFFCAALRDASAARVTAVAPYLCYARKDRRTKPRDPVITRYVAQMFEALGVDRIVALDVHNPAAFENAFRARTEHVEALPLLVEHLAPTLAGRGAVVLSPDLGGGKRAERLRQALEAALERPVSFALMEKHRSGGVVSGELFAGEVDGRTVVILDDLISTGSTLARAARASRERGAAHVIVAATHGLFVDGAPALFGEEAIDRIVTTNTVPPFRVPDGRRAKLTVLDVAPLLAEAVGRLHAGEG